MELVRTTLRLKTNLKKTAELKARQEGTTFQAIYNQALEEFLKRDGEKKAKEIIFKTHDLGEPLDNLTRTDFYYEQRRPGFLSVDESKNR